MIIFKELYDLFTKLQLLGFKSWLDFGQLLGAYRSNEFLSWDKDIDFCVVCDTETEWTKLREIIFDEFKPKFKQSLPGKLLRVEKHGWSIDFFRAIEKDKWMDFTMYSEQMSMRSFFYDELEKININGVEFNSPRHLPLYLQIRYGDDWFIPKMKNCRNVRKNPRQDLQLKEFKVITSGVFDLLHEGHINLLKKCNKHFDHVTVGIHSDEVVESYKRKPIWNQEERYDKLKQTGLCDVIEKEFPLISTEKIIEKYDFIVFGEEDSNSKYYNKSIKNHPIKRTENISTTILIQESL
jgi:cytidyltransferase-like protein